MDPIESGPGQDESPALTYSSRGRQRKKNSKYCDYETDLSSDLQSSGQNPQKTEAAGGGAAKKSPVKRGKAESDEKREATDESSEEETRKKSPRAKKTPPKKKTPAKRTPAKRTPAKKTPIKRTPAQKTPAETTPAPNGAGGVADAAQPENGTPKPKRRYVRKQPPKEPVEEPVEEQASEEETTPSGRHRRSAAKVALKYLHILANEVLNRPGDDLGPPPTGRTQSLKGRNGRKSQKRKRCDSDAAEDEDFNPDVEADEEEEGEEEETEDEEVEEDSDSGSDRPTPHHMNQSRKTPNGLTSNVMQTVWDAMNTVKQFDLETYLPQELQSAAFRVTRDGLGKEKTPLERLGRFSAKPAHPDRWDMLLCAGGPVWAMEWCPTPDGTAASQYIALGCHRGMEDKHCVNKTHGGGGLVQLWHLGTLKYNSRPDSQPALAYGLAQDSGFVWTLKWCPAGGWELPSCDRKVSKTPLSLKAPFLPRLGLLAVATSNSVVTIYSLPHPDALNHSTGLTARSQVLCAWFFWWFGDQQLDYREAVDVWFPTVNVTVPESAGVTPLSRHVLERPLGERRGGVPAGNQTLKVNVFSLVHDAALQEPQDVNLHLCDEYKSAEPSRNGHMSVSRGAFDRFGSSRADWGSKSDVRSK
ncbi:General transcription factor 3C polypeptide 2 [Liparis tanakae]|uniref:General transcription factor 3C polypeptide 2 n=1 Tax=Liparis tanakae TaxID=230148 RepID=A0A4Z2FW26_9TELE|nr:General transcription factor 3C polypeptide 2 [Liparis tanakae]